MRNFLSIIILILSFSCKDNKIIEVKEKNNTDRNNKNTYDQIQKIGHLYKPEKITTETDGQNFQITLTNSVLDKKYENLQNHSKKISALYHNHLVKTLGRFNFKKIIVKIEHRNEKSESYEFTAENFR